MDGWDTRPWNAAVLSSVSLALIDQMRQQMPIEGISKFPLPLTIGNKARFGTNPPSQYITSEKNTEQIMIGEFSFYIFSSSLNFSNIILRLHSPRPLIPFPPSILEAIKSRSQLIIIVDKKSR